jgi:hypothetical protein
VSGEQMSADIIDDQTLHIVATKLQSLNHQYINGSMKHYQYADQYDKVLEAYRITKKQLVAALEKRKNPTLLAKETKTITLKKVLL